MTTLLRTEQSSPRLLTVNSPAQRILIVTLLVVIGLVIVYLATQEEVIFSTRMSLIVGYVIGVPILLSANYNRSIMMIFLFASVAGLLKYKTDFNPVVHVTIDIMMVIVCFGWAIRRFFAARSSDKPISTPCEKLILIFVAICVLQLFNAYTYSYLASLAALKMHILMIPLFFFGYHYTRSIEQLRQRGVVFGIIALVMSTAAVSQFQKGPDQVKAEMPEYTSIIDQNTWQDETGRSFFRPMSTTSNAGGASTWMQCIIPLTLALCMAKFVSKRLRFFMITTLAICIMTLFISLIRQMFVVTAISLVLMLFLQLMSRKLGQGALVVIALSVMVLGGYNLAKNVAGTSSGALLGLIDTASNPVSAFQQNNRYVMLGVVWQVAQMYPLGAGLGRTGPAAVKFYGEIQAFYDIYSEHQWRSQMHAPSMMPSENYFLVLMSETGIPGTIIMVLIVLVLLWKGLKAYIAIQDDSLKWYSASCLGILVSIFIVFFGGPALITAPLNLFFWFLGGVLLKLPELDRSLRTEIAPSPVPHLSTAHFAGKA